MIYIVSRGNSDTGGPETLHQAAGKLKSKGIDTFIYYIDPKSRKAPERFREYGVDVAMEISDNEKNVLIVPETLTYFLHSFKKIRKVIWWLSVDHFEDHKLNYQIKMRLKARHWPSFLWPVEFAGFILKKKGRVRFRCYRFRDGGKYFHFYNCEYAHQYILSHGVSEENTLYMCGPINQTFFDLGDSEEHSGRENIILYNPLKGKEFSEKVILWANERGLKAEFIAIHDMTPQEVADLMKKAKIYMDFGNFPGPERIPREAVICGCNIITSRSGSAANEIDVPIPDRLKFNAADENRDEIITTLDGMLQSYSDYYSLYDAYREKVKRQVDLFEAGIEYLADLYALGE